MLRYHHCAKAEPLWLGAAGRPRAVPPCERCGAARWFEFQLLPQLVSAIAAEGGDGTTLVDGLNLAAVSISRPAKAEERQLAYGPFAYLTEISNPGLCMRS